MRSSSSLSSVCVPPFHQTLSFQTNKRHGKEKKNTYRQSNQQWRHPIAWIRGLNHGIDGLNNNNKKCRSDTSSFLPFSSSRLLVLGRVYWIGKEHPSIPSSRKKGKKTIHENLMDSAQTVMLSASIRLSAGRQIDAIPMP